MLPLWILLGSLKNSSSFGPTVWPTKADTYMSEELYHIDLEITMGTKLKKIILLSKREWE